MVLPIGPLMIEHRLIERMIALMKKELVNIKETRKINLVFIDDAVNFIQSYADRCHHGKEEDILFKELSKKDLSSEHKKIMNELIEEHKWGRKITKELIEAKKMFTAGNVNSLKKIIQLLEELIDFYPKHIEKEDKHFFKPVMDYFSKEELNNLLEVEYAFDKNFIHKIYQDKITSYEKKIT
ncbi:MAG TPA: hemerythrin domain-containing protein [candidate division Zixibacteria bacterium]|nr:hemerythrin domain-containing protein [candidate division Zixibacteria bacterium]